MVHGAWCMVYGACRVVAQSRLDEAWTPLALGLDGAPRAAVVFRLLEAGLDHHHLLASVGGHHTIPVPHPPLQTDRQIESE